MEENHKDFFISYTKADRPWAEWIAWQLEHAGYSVIVQAWDFLAGSNFVLEMHKAAIEAEQTIAVLSPDYLNALYTQPEWAAALVQDPTGADSKLLPVRVQACKPQGILTAVSYIDLVGLDSEQDTQEKLLRAIRRQRAKPKTAPPFPLPRRDVPQTWTVSPRFPGALPALWNVPYHRNMFFTGREDILERLNGTLSAHQTTALTQPQAINGLGGIGKSQTAIEYIYRYHTDYQAILWVQADSPEVLIADFVKLAGLLDVPEKDETEQPRIIEAVKRWFHTHTHWLLILDNVEQVEQIEPFIPQGGGHVLLTTRASVAEPVAQSISLDKMSEDEATAFLLRRTGTVSTDVVLQTAHETARHDARKLAQVMDGLPLALDQAGAYILETHCGLAGYLALYQQQRAELLKQRGPTLGHPEPVAATWSLSFEKVRQTNPQAAQLLQFCAFLYPDAIAEELLTTPISGQKPPALVNNLLELHKAIKVLGDYSLIRRYSESMMLSMHRLVQAVLRDTLPKGQHRKWGERAICVVSSLFPSGEPETWPQCELYLLHAQTCSEWIEGYTITIPEAARLMNDAATYLKARGLSREAVPFAQRALAIREQVLGPNHPDTAQSLNNLAVLYRDQGKYAQAEPLYQRALDIREQVLGPNHPDTARTLNNLARLYYRHGKYAQAELLYQRAFAIRELVLGPNHPHTATSLNNMGSLYHRQGKYTEAELLLKRAFAIREQVLGPNHPDTATSLNDLAGLYHSQGKYMEAEPLLKRAFAIREQVYGSHHPDTARSLNYLAYLYHRQGNSAEAEPLLKCALATKEELLGLHHPSTATSLNNLATLYESQGKYTEAEPLYQRAFAIRELVLGPNHPDTAHSLNDLAVLYDNQGNSAEAEPLYQRAFAIRELVLGPNHPDTASSLNNLASLYTRQEEYDKAESLLKRALTIRELVLGTNHPDTASSLNNLAVLYENQGNSAKAEPLYQRALAIYELVIGLNHPITLVVRNNYARSSQQQRQ